MAAPGPEASDGDSSEEEAAAWQRLREAAWDPALGRAAALGPVENSKKRNQQASESSIREKIRNHEQEGNELQTTPGFRAFVAKKLDTILDNAITLSTGPLRLPPQNSSTSLEEDEGFRLFSSSVPGDCGEPEAAPGKRSAALQHSSSSVVGDSSSSLDSDAEWQRCQEAAVTAADILKQSGLPPPAAQESGQTIEARWKEVKKKKKKGKRKESGQPEAIKAGDKEPSCPSRPEAVSWTGLTQRKRKKERRRTEAGTE